MSHTLKGKTALVTGGSRGIGKAIAEKYASSGANVVITYKSSGDLAEEVVGQMRRKHPENGRRFETWQADGASFGQAEELASWVAGEFGAIDVLVNNAGITADNLLLRMGEEQWDSVMLNNLKSVFNLTRHVLRQMLRQRSGSIVNMSSVVGLSGNPGQSNYAASKAGIIGFTKSVAQEVGSRGIRCNALAPGFIQTDMTDALPEERRKYYMSKIPLKRFGKVEEVADAALFLASDASSYITGQVISICGGIIDAV